MAHQCPAGDAVGLGVGDGVADGVGIGVGGMVRVDPVHPTSAARVTVDQKDKCCTRS